MLALRGSGEENSGTLLRKSGNVRRDGGRQREMGCSMFVIDLRQECEEAQEHVHNVESLGVGV